jgi:hypothetical protein
VIVALGVEPDEVETVRCGSLAVGPRVSNLWGVEEERDVPIVVCREPHITLQELWARRAPEQ